MIRKESRASPSASSRARRIAIAQISGTTFLWGTIPVGVKLALPSFDPYAISFLRYALSVLFLLGVLAVQRKRWSWPQAPKGILLAGGVASAANYLFYNVGLTKTTASAAAFIIQGESAVLALLAWLVLRERWTAAKAWGITLCTLGVCIVGWGGQPWAKLFNSQTFLGNLMVFCAGVSWAIYAVCQKAVAPHADPLSSLLAFLGLSALFTGLFWAAHWTPPHHLTPVSVADMIYMGLFGTGLSYWLLALALQNMDAGTAGMWTTPLPLVSAILAYSLLHERPSVYTGAGGAFVLAGLLMLSKHED